MPFSPSDISGLKGWWKADGTLWQDSARTTAATADADPVGSWDDASGTGNHLLQATAGKRPLLKTNIVNGKPVLRLDGVDDSWQVTLAATLSQPNTIFIVGGETSSAAHNWFDGIASGNRHALARGLSGDAAKVGIYSGNAIIEIAHTASATVQIWLASFDNVNTTRNRVRRGADGVQASGDPAASQTLTGLTLGSRYTSASDWFPGDIAEVLLYNADLTDAQLDQVGNYLASKYALTWTNIVVSSFLAAPERVPATVAVRQASAVF